MTSKQKTNVNRIKLNTWVFALAILGSLCAISGPAVASVIYDNGPINGTVGSYPINSINGVSDSFIVSSDDTSLGSAEVGLWAIPYDPPISVEWSIGTTPFANDVSSGTAGLYSNTYGYAGPTPIFQSFFDLSGTLDAGTYYLTLQNAVSTAGSTLGWDVNSGPSIAYQYDTTQPVASESFTLFTTQFSGQYQYGPNGPVPDQSSTFLLLSLSCLMFVCMARRTRNRVLA